MTNYGVPITVLPPQRKRKKAPMKARGSALKRGGHKPLTEDELPTPNSKSSRNTYGITEVSCNAKALMAWAKKWEGNAVIFGAADKKVLATIPLDGQKYKTVKALITMLRLQSNGQLMMRHTI